MRDVLMCSKVFFVVAWSKKRQKNGQHRYNTMCLTQENPRILLKIF